MAKLSSRSFLVVAIVVVTSATTCHAGQQDGVDNSLVANLRNLSKNVSHVRSLLANLSTQRPTVSTAAVPEEVDDDGNVTDDSRDTDTGLGDWLTGRNWWEGPAVCISESGNRTNSNVAVTPGANSASKRDVPDRNVLTMCHVTENIRLCRSLSQSINGTEAEEIMTTYRCCPGHKLIGNECTNISDASSRGNHTHQKTPDQSTTKGMSNDADQLQGPHLLSFFRQLMEGSLRSQVLLQRAMESDASSTFEMDDDKFEPAMMPVVFVNGPSKGAQNSQQHKPENTTSPDGTIQKTHSDLHLSLIL